MVGLLLAKVSFFFALTYALIRYSKIYRLVKVDQPLSIVVLISSIAILVMSSHFKFLSHQAIVTDISQICIFFSLINMYVQKNFVDNRATS